MGILSWIIVGLIAGWLAQLVMGGGYGILGTILLGIVGAIVGGFIFSALLGGPGVGGLDIGSILVAFIGAVIVIWIARALGGRRTI
jgi:uncharacterized membrane protein YeaQ/YmgE (transglycosylase-associated protein family)